MALQRNIESSTSQKNRPPVWQGYGERNTTFASALPDERVPSREALGTGLGWVSLAIGLGELFFTRAICESSGVDSRHATVLRIFGARQVTSGIGLLRGKDRRAWMICRVVGDAIDGAFLGWCFFTEKETEARKKLALTAATIAPIVALDLYNTLRTDF